MKIQQLAFAWLLLSALAMSPVAAAKGKADLCKSGKQLRVAIDIGHSKRDPGAISARGKSEYAFNRRFVTEFIQSKRKNRFLDPVVINPSGKPIRLGARTRQAKSKNADIFLSFHHDSVNRRYIKKWIYKNKSRLYTDYARGFSIFVSKRNRHFGKSYALAHNIGLEFVANGLKPTLHHAEKIKGENRKLLNRKLGIYDAPFAVLKTKFMPSVLVELGVILNREEEVLLNSLKYRQKLGRLITRALKRYCQ